LDSIRLTEYLTQNHDEVLTVLNTLGYIDIQHNKIKNEVRFSREDGRNPSSVRLNLNTLGFICFSNNTKGNLYTLVMNKTNITYFPDVLNYVANILGLEKRQFSNKIKYPFGGFYKNLIREIQEPELCMQTYEEDILEPYLHKYNTMFFNDGIDYQTQEHFKIGYDLETNRITVPEYTVDGKLCGIMGRSIWSKESHETRWLPIIPCSRTLTLYGYHQNYQKIQEKGLCIIGESEKYPQQLHSFDCHIGLATCGNNISPVQEKYIKSLLVPKVILAYDEGLEEEYIREEAQKLKIDNQIFKNEVGYIYDDDNTYLPKGSKASPSDFGKVTFNKLVQEKVRLI
jgi:DNA primase